MFPDGRGLVLRPWRMDGGVIAWHSSAASSLVRPELIIYFSTPMPINCGLADKIFSTLRDCTRRLLGSTNNGIAQQHILRARLYC